MTDWDQILEKFETIVGPTRLRDDVVEAAYLTTRLISYRAVLASQGVSPKAYLARITKSSRESRRLALRVIDEIVQLESAPLEKIPQDALDFYAAALSEIVRRRLKRDLQYDEQRADAILEEFRRAG